MYRRLRKADAALSSLDSQNKESEAVSPASASLLSEEEKTVLRCMRSCMEQHGAHLSPAEKVRGESSPDRRGFFFLLRAHPFPRCASTARKNI